MNAWAWGIGAWALLMAVSFGMYHLGRVHEALACVNAQVKIDVTEG